MDNTISFIREHAVIVLMAILIPGDITELIWWLGMLSFIFLLHVRDYELGL